MKGRELPKQNMYSVFKEFYSIEPIIRQGMEEHSKNYMVIRLVTVVEQFFRCVVENYFHKHPDLIPQISVRNKEAVYGNIFADAEWSMRRDLNLVMVSATYSFQSTYTIKKEMKKLGLSDKALENKVDYLDTLFCMRHALIHTVEPRLCNVDTLKEYYGIIEEIMEMTLNKLNIPEFSFYLQKGMAFFSLGWRVGSENDIDGCFIDEQIDIILYAGQNDELKLSKVREYNEKARICFDAALKRFKSIIKEDPNDLETLVEMIDIYAKCQDRTNMEAYTNRVLKIEPGNTLACHYKGMFLLLKTKHNTALTWFKKSVDGDQYIPITYELLLHILIRTGKNEDALIHVDRAIGRRPNDPILYFMKCRILDSLNMKSCEEACKSLGSKKAIDFFESHYNNQSECYGMMHKLQGYGNRELIDKCRAVIEKHLGRRPA